MTNRTVRDRVEAGRVRTRVPARWAWHFRTLLALRDHLRRDAGDRTRDPCDAMEPPSLHGADVIDDLYDRELAAALPADPAEALAEVESALQKIAAGTYGCCEATGRRIAPGELRAQPWRRRAAAAPAGRRSRTKAIPSHATKKSQIPSGGRGLSPARGERGPGPGHVPAHAGLAGSGGARDR